MTLRIDDLAPGGDGVAHADQSGTRRAIFVPRTAQGDVVVAQVDFSERPARASLVEVVEGGPTRVAPSCPFVEACGACDWMHLSREAQRAARESHLRRALPEAWRDVPVAHHDDVPSLGYRTRARLHVRVSGGRALVGPHAARSRDIVAVPTCIVLDPTLDALVAKLAAFFEGGDGRGELQMALGEGGKPVLDVRWTGRLAPSSFGRFEVAVTSGELAGASIALGDVLRPAVIGDPRPVIQGADGRPLTLASGGFAQASSAGNLALAGRVVALAEGALAGRPKRGVLELYAGAGNFTVLLASLPLVGRIVAVESDGAACDAARENVRARGLSAHVAHGDADVVEIPDKTDLVVLDPPRRGAKDVCARLARSKVSSVLYVSCDAPTLGRDLGALAASYDLVNLESFGMFPGTSHSETLAFLRRKPRAGAS
jgi:23S rRNA (uracil1939-C5)-methyltransferase